MTKLVYAVRNMLVQHTEVTSLLGIDDLDDPMIYAYSPEATIENTGKSMIVINVESGWGANDHNTARFPTLVIDIWSDPTRNADLSVQKKDASLKAEAVYEAIDKLLHLVDKSVPGGGAVYWGTATEIANKTGIRINSSARQNEPMERPAFDNQGAVVWTVRYDVSI
jgi:hypothetical protein